MKKLLFRIAGILATFTAPLLISSVAHAATITWSGGGAAVSGAYNMSDTANWVGGVVPTTGDVLSFPFTVPAAQRVINNDLAADTSFVGIQFSGTNADCTTSPNLILSGNRIVLTGDISDTSTVCTKAIYLDINLGANIALTSSGANTELGMGDGSNTLAMGAFNLTVNTPNTGSQLFLNHKLTGSGTVSLSGFMELNGDNSGYSGPITITPTGNVRVNSNNSLGTTAGATTVQSNGTIQFCANSSSTTYDENLILSGNGSIAGPTGGAIATSTCVGSGAGGFNVYIPNLIILSGNVTLTSNTVVSAYESVKLTGALSGAFTITPVDTLLHHGSLIIASSSNTSSTPNGTYAPTIVTTTLTDDQSASPLVVTQNEVVVINGKRGGTDVVGTLKGTGTVGILNVYAGARLAPGLSPGCINSGNLTLSGNYDVELQDIVACTKYDQTVVTGTVDVTGGTLNIIRYNNMVPRIGNAFKIIDNDGTDAVTGTFAGLAQGATTTVDGITYTISYTGGDGNDVVLTVTGVNASLGAPNTGALQLLKAGAVLPLLAMLSGVGILAVQVVTAKRR